MKTTAIILSGGKGTRFGSDIPKQYLRIKEKEILAYTLMAFQKSGVDEIIIVAAEEYLEKCRKIALENGCSKVTAVIHGGTERYDSVYEGLKFLNRQDTENTMTQSQELNVMRSSDETENQIVLIHDGARPFIKPGIIDQLVREIEIHGAAIAAAPCTDTIKLINENAEIIDTTNRRLTWSAQTPQGFYLTPIYSAYKMVLDALRRKENNNKIACSQKLLKLQECLKSTSVTDDAMVYQLVYPERCVKVVDAGSENFKITKPQDLKLAELILQ